MIANLYDILNAAKTYFLSNGWNGFFALGQKRVNGDNGTISIVIPKEGNDFIDIAPTDEKGNYVYIRTLSDTVAHNAAKIGSCTTIKQSISLRIVGVWNDANISDYSLSDKLFNDLLYFAKYNSFGGNMILTPQFSILNANDIFLDELGVDMQQRNLAIAAIDFNLQYNLINCNKKPPICPVDVAPIVC